jgi:hypothetical protein
VLSSHSGLLNYLFGVNREKVLTKEHLKKLQMGKKVLTSRRMAEYFEIIVFSYYFASSLI